MGMARCGADVALAGVHSCLPPPPQPPQQQQQQRQRLPLPAKCCDTVLAPRLHTPTYGIRVFTVCPRCAPPPADIGNEEKLEGVAQRIKKLGRKVITLKVDVRLGGAWLGWRGWAGRSERGHYASMSATAAPSTARLLSRQRRLHSTARQLSSQAVPRPYGCMHPSYLFITPPPAAGTRP